MLKDTAFQMAASNIRFGRGITHELGMDLAAMEVRRTMLVIDPNLVSLPAGQAVLESLERNSIECEVFDAVPNNIRPWYVYVFYIVICTEN